MSPQLDDLKKRIEMLEIGADLIKDYQPIAICQEWNERFKVAIREADILYFLSLRRGDKATALKTATELCQLLMTTEPERKTQQPKIIWDGDGKEIY